MAQEQPVAMVEGKALLPSDLDPPALLRSQYRSKLPEKEYATWLAQTRSDRLAGLIWAAVKKQFCLDKECAATEADIAAFSEAMGREYQKQRAKDEARLWAIGTALAGALTAAEREKLEQEKGLLESVRSALDSTTPERERLLSEPWVGSWKFYRALYRTYGGRVIFQQAGPEPLDAMTKVLREQEARGTFAIHDAGMHRKFWAYFTTMGHTFMSDGAEFMETPWWLRAPKKP